METVTQNYNDPIIPPHAGEGACPATPHGATQGQKPLRVREENGDERETPSPSTKFVIENSPCEQRRNRELLGEDRGDKQIKTYG